MIGIVRCVQGEVHVYDSMGHTDLPQDVKQQIAALILIPTKNITLIFNQSKDNKILTIVEIFNIASATSICFTATPSSLLYDQACLRPYLTKCFMSGTMEPFPTRERKAQRPYSQVQYYVYCSCRLMRGEQVVTVALNGTTKRVKQFQLLCS